jgi:hypothetical protein
MTNNERMVVRTAPALRNRWWIAVDDGQGSVPELHR